MIQEIIVGIIGIVIAVLIVYKIYKFFFTKNKGEGACGCASCHCNVSKR